MKKEERIRRYGKAAYEKRLQQSRDWKKTNLERARENRKRWKAANPDKDQGYQHNINRKGGKYYGQHKQHQMNGIPHEKELVRQKHGHLYRPYKKIIAPESQLHHEWIPGTAEYTGVALVEAKPHQYGYIDVIQILEGEITLLTEEAIRKGGMVI